MSYEPEEFRSQVYPKLRRLGFYKLYLEDGKPLLIQELLRTTITTVRITFWLLNIMKRNTNQVYVTRAILIKEGYTRSEVESAFRFLKGKDFIRRIENGRYMFSPYMLAYGNDMHVDELRRIWYLLDIGTQAKSKYKAKLAPTTEQYALETPYLLLWRRPGGVRIADDVARMNDDTLKVFLIMLSELEDANESSNVDGNIFVGTRRDFARKFHCDAHAVDRGFSRLRALDLIRRSQYTQDGCTRRAYMLSPYLVSSYPKKAGRYRHIELYWLFNAWDELATT